MHSKNLAAPSEGCCNPVLQQQSLSLMLTCPLGSRGEKTQGVHRKQPIAACMVTARLTDWLTQLQAPGAGSAAAAVTGACLCSEAALKQQKQTLSVLRWGNYLGLMTETCRALLEQKQHAKCTSSKGMCDQSSLAKEPAA